MKTIVITGNDEQLSNALEKCVNSVGGVEIALSAPFNEETLKNISFAQPDFVICDLLAEEQVRAIIDVCMNTTIVFISDDSNRSEFTISSLNKEGYYDFINLDKNKITPKGVLELLRDYVPDNNFNDFEEINENEVEAKTISDKSEAPQNSSSASVDPNVAFNPAFEEFDKTSNNATYSPAQPSSDKDEVTKIYRNDDDVNKVSQSQVVAVYSKKGGTGKTTIAKEIAHIFSEITLPKKMASKSNLDVCLVDMSFDNGDLRSVLGVTSPSPNLYVLMDAIISRMETGVPLDRIYFSSIEIKTNFCISLPFSDVKLICLNQGEFPKKLAERILAFGDDNLLENLIKKIIKILKGTFNVVVIDTNAAISDINNAILRSASKVIYPMQITMSDIDNLKTFLDITKENCYVANKIVPFINKRIKTSFNQDFLNLYDQVKAIHTDLPDIEIFVPYDETIININNNFGFYNAGESEFKNGIIRACSKILPVFKVKSISKDLTRLNKVRMQQAKLQKAKEAKKNAEKINKEKAKPVNTPAPTKSTNEVPKGENSAVDYLKSDLSKVTAEEFIAGLKACSDIPLTKKGFPKLFNKPTSLNKKVWKKYQKMLGRNI